MSKHETPARTDGDATSQAPDNYFANTQIDLRKRSWLPASRLATDRHPDDAHRTGFTAGIQAARDIVKQLREQEGYDAGNAMLLDRLDLAIREVQDNGDAR